MTEKQLIWRVISVVIILLSIFGFALICRFGFRSEEGYSSIKDFSPLFLGIGGAYLAYCFQRRQAFLSNLKDVWKEMVLSRLLILKYINNKEKNSAVYESAYEQISKTVDLVRSVYPNVDESRSEIGFYPFQPLREMLHALDRLNPERLASTPKKEREVIDQAWDALRYSFLPEFSRPPATRPLVTYAAADPRRAVGKTRVEQHEKARR